MYVFVKQVNGYQILRKTIFFLKPPISLVSCFVIIFFKLHVQEISVYSPSLLPINTHPSFLPMDKISLNKRTGLKHRLTQRGNRSPTHSFTRKLGALNNFQQGEQGPMNTFLRGEQNLLNKLFTLW